MTTPTIKMQGVRSTLIKTYGYDPNTRTLAICFRGKDGNVGPLYHYANVTPEHYKQMTEVESKGQFFLNNFKRAADLFPATKIEPDEAPKKSDAA